MASYTSYGRRLESVTGAKLSNSKFNSIINEEALLTGDNTDHIIKFNRFDIPEGFTYLNGLRGYLFFTRPDLNILNGSGVLNDTLANVAGYREMFKNGSNVDRMIIKSLQQDTDFDSPYLPVLSNQIKGYTPEDQTLDSYEKGDTHHGSKIRYGKHSTVSRTSGSFSLSVEDTSFLSVYKLISIWTDYIERVFIGDTDPKETYIKNGILDYAVSVYYIATKLDGAEIMYWEKQVGVIPKNRPDSAFGTTKGQVTSPEYSLQFECSLKSRSSILDPHVLSEINTLSNTTKSKVSGALSSYDLAKGRITFRYR